jgi:hypothetical protein
MRHSAIWEMHEEGGGLEPSVNKRHAQVGMWSTSPPPPVFSPYKNIMVIREIYHDKKHPIQGPLYFHHSRKILLWEKPAFLRYYRGKWENSPLANAHLEPAAWGGNDYLVLGQKFLPFLQEVDEPSTTFLKLHSIWAPKKGSFSLYLPPQWLQKGTSVFINTFPSVMT